MSKYLKTWMGRTSGTPGGRDDGYPELKTSVIDSIDDLIGSYDKNATYYRLEEVDISAAVQAFKDFETN